MSKKIIILAGPNGAGKTTFARALLPEEAQCRHFINADLIAAGLSPFAPETAAFKAGRLSEPAPSIMPAFQSVATRCDSKGLPIKRSSPVRSFS